MEIAEIPSFNRLCRQWRTKGLSIYGKNPKIAHLLPLPFLRLKFVRDLVARFRGSGLGSVRFLKPVAVGETLTARAHVDETEGKKRKVRCEVLNQGREKVLAGEFLCPVLNQRVLEKKN